MIEIDSRAFGNKIKNIRNSKHFSLRQVSNQSKDETGVAISPSYWSLVERGKRNIPKPQTLKRIAKGLRVDESDVFRMAGLEAPTEATNLTRITSSEMVSVPIIGEIACGEPITAIENVSGHMLLPNNLVKGGDYFILKCIGKSMEPTIMNDSNVLVRAQPDVENGQIAAVLLDDDTTATLKRIKKTKNSVILMPDNPDFEPIVLNEDKPGRIIGVVKMEMKMF
ncbi:helix-turn-helix domain-containing protein [Fructilactobacillus cliffordii]|uniref:helix-turn-helix domain-containing protein n=1 Tax=Fructilactobacillus cliffordii TaxID=2940299 RepID=UPI0020926847|nr:XRE family transcriptional regulator [Fructilactobacillus cliffordii]USS86453.1 helix-turn-helix domain-containing protein [Fructilactobacillus cliffordii]